MARAYTFRLTAEGIQDIERQLKALGAAGETAFKRIAETAPQFQDAFRKSQEEIERARAKLANQNVFDKIGASAEALEKKTKGATRGLNDVRGTLELLGPAAGSLGDGFGGLVRLVGNVGDAFGALGAILGKNPMAVAITAAGLLGAAVVGLTVKTFDAADAQKKYEAALKSSDEVLRTSAETTAKAVGDKQAEAIQTNLVSLKIEQENLARLERLRLRQQEAELDASMAASPGVDRRGSRDIEAQIVDAHARLNQVRGQISQLADPAESGTNREAAAKDQKDLEAAALKQYLEGIDRKFEEEEKNLTELAKLRKSNHETTIEARKEFIAAEMKLVEEDSRVQQEAAKATTEYLVKEAERRDRDVFGAGAQRAAADYWDSLTQHGRRAGQFVSGSVLRPMEDSLSKFFATGKGKISDFFDSVKMGVARLAAQDVIGGIGGALGFGSGGSSAIMAGASAAGSFLGSLFGFKDGGRPPLGQWSLVGEEGPELVKFDRPATVYSSGNSRSMARQLAAEGMGGDTELVHLMPKELPILRAVLGPGRINPRTGLWGFADSPDGGFGGSTDTGHDTGTGSNAAAGSAPSGQNSMTEMDNLGETSPSPSFRSMGGEADDRAVAAYSQAREMGFDVSFSAHVASLAQTLGPTADMASLIGRTHFDLSMQNVGFFGRLGYALGDLVGVGRWGGFFASPAADILSALLTGLIPGVGLPGMAMRGIAGIGLSATRSAISGEPSRGFGASIANALADVMTGQNTIGVSFSNQMGQVAASLDRSFGLDGSRSFGVANDNGRLGITSADLGVDAFGMGGAARAAAARADLAGDLSDLQGGLAGAWQSGPVATGNNVMASLPRFHQGGEMTVGAGGEQLVSLLARTGEKVSVGTPEQLGGTERAVEGQTRVMAEGLTRLLKAVEATNLRLDALARRVEEQNRAA
jgi:hypothetical protein